MLATTAHRFVLRHDSRSIAVMLADPDRDQKSGWKIRGVAINRDHAISAGLLTEHPDESEIEEFEDGIGDWVTQEVRRVRQTW